MHVFKKKKSKSIIKDNSGLSFVEILVAVTLLAIIVGPIMNSIIATAKVNKQAREIMSANDMAQDIMEGFSDKSFYAVSSIYSGGTGEGEGGVTYLVGKYALSQINDKKYNNISSKVKISGTDFPELGSVSKTAIVIDGVNCPTVNIANDSLYIGTDKASNHIIDLFATHAIEHMGADKAAQKLVMYADNAASPNCIFFAYTNVEWENRRYDVVGYMLPAAETSADYYFPYCMKVAVYEVHNYNAEAATATHYGINNHDSMLSLSGGVKNY